MKERTVDGDYSLRALAARMFAGLVTCGIGYILRQACDVVVRLVPSVDLGPVAITTSWVTLVASIVVIVPFWKAYGLYARWLVRIGWLKPPRPKEDRTPKR